MLLSRCPVCGSEEKPGKGHLESDQHQSALRRMLNSPLTLPTVSITKGQRKYLLKGK